MATRSPEPFRVALTFDAEHPDRPALPGVQERLLDLLESLDVRATFFIQGRWAEAYPAVAARIARDGHLVGNHSHYHARMPHLGDDGLAFDISSAERAIVETTGVDPRPWFRCPFGAGANDPRVLGAIEAAGYRHVGWTVEAADWEPEPHPRAIADLTFEGCLEQRDGSIALLHTWPHRTEAALPGLVGRLRAEGATLVGIDELEPEAVTAGVPWSRIADQP